MEEYVNDADLFRFNSFLKGPVGGVYHEIGPDLPSLEDLFPENAYYAILFKRNPDKVVGHWVVLIKFSDTVFEILKKKNTKYPHIKYMDKERHSSS
jgi:hypothetical protein